MRQVGDGFAVGGSVGSAFALMFDSFKSFNPMSEPIDDSSCGFDGIPEQRERELEDSGELVNGTTCSFGASGKVENDFTFRHEPPVSVHDVEINVPLDEKAGSNIVSDNGYTSSLLTDLERKSLLQWEGRKQHKNGQINRFLPPSTMVAGEDCISVRPQQKGGRLVLKTVEVPCFQAERSDGHLKLQFSNLRVARRAVRWT